MVSDVTVHKRREIKAGNSPKDKPTFAAICYWEIIHYSSLRITENTDRNMPKKDLKEKLLNMLSISAAVITSII